MKTYTCMHVCWSYVGLAYSIPTRIHIYCAVYKRKYLKEKYMFMVLLCSSNSFSNASSSPFYEHRLRFRLRLRRRLLHRFIILIPSIISRGKLGLCLVDCSVPFVMLLLNFNLFVICMQHIHTFMCLHKCMYACVQVEYLSSFMVFTSASDACDAFNRFWYILYFMFVSTYAYDAHQSLR